MKYGICVAKLANFHMNYDLLFDTVFKEFNHISTTMIVFVDHIKMDGIVSQRCVSKFKIEVRICIPAIK